MAERERNQLEFPVKTAYFFERAGLSFMALDGKLTEVDTNQADILLYETNLKNDSAVYQVFFDHSKYFFLVRVFKDSKPVKIKEKEAKQILGDDKLVSLKEPQLRKELAELHSEQRKFTVQVKDWFAKLRA